MSVRLGPIGPGPNALTGAAATLCAVAAMVAVSALALVLLGAGSVGSPWSMTMALTAMAVGGSVSADGSGDAGSMDSGLGALFGGGGGGLSPSLSGAVQVVPLGVTLVGAVVLWLAFSRRLRLRRLDAGELAARAAGAGACGLLVLAVVATLGQGEITLSASAMSGLRGGGAGDPLGGLLGEPGGSGMTDTATSYEAHVGTAAFGALLWVAVTLAVGCVIGRRVRVPLGGTLDRLRDTWAPSVSAVVRTLLVLVFIPVVPLTLVGTVVGGRAGMAAGVVLLLAPNGLAVLLTLGAGAPWMAEAHPVESAEGNPLASLMGGTGGAGMGPGSGTRLDATENLRSLAAGGLPLWPVALGVLAIVLLGCAYAAARTGNPAHARALHGYRGRFTRQLGVAERFGVVTAVVLGGAAWLAGASGRFSISMFGSEMTGTRAELSGGALSTAALGLLAGSLAGFAGSLLATRRGTPTPH